MKAIRLYVEGGGDSIAQRREMRNGMDALLHAQKTAAQKKRLRWSTVFHGGRQETFEAFIHALETADADALMVLLVDSEDLIAPEVKNAEEANAQRRVEHLATRDGWDFSDADPKQVHLMVCCTEAWIVADPEAVAAFYGKGFHAKSLPSRTNLEEEPKADLLDKLRKATEKTQKGAYAKVKHTGKLLERIDANKIGKRCCRFTTFTSWLSQRIHEA